MESPCWWNNAGSKLYPAAWMFSSKNLLCPLPADFLSNLWADWSLFGIHFSICCIRPGDIALGTSP